jgi:hypothetical protein
MSNVDPQRGKTQRHPADPRCRGFADAATPVVRLAKGTHHGQPPRHARPRRRLHRDPRCPRTLPDPQRPTGLRLVRGYRHRRVHGLLGPHRRPPTKTAPCVGPRADAAHGRPLRAHPGGGRCRDLRRPRSAGDRAAPPLARGRPAGLADGAATGARRAGRGPGRCRRPQPARSRAGPGDPVDQPAQRPQADPPRARPRPVPGPAARRFAATRHPRKTHR